MLAYFSPANGINAMFLHRCTATVDLPLMPGAITRYAAWKDFATFGDEESECLYIFVIDKGSLVHTEPADFFSDLEASPFVAASTSGIPAVSPVFSSVIGTSIGWS